jgi:hypothetical protein
MHSCPYCANLVRSGSSACPHCETSLLTHPLTRTAAAVLMGLTLTACPGGGVAKYGAPPSDDTAASPAAQVDAPSTPDQG